MAQLGVCLEGVVDGACSNFVVLDNIVSSDPALFDWEMFGIYTGSALLLWATGCAFGYVVKAIKKGSRY